MAKYMQYRLPDGGGGGLHRRSGPSVISSVIGGIASLVGFVFVVVGCVLETVAEIGITVLALVLVFAAIHALLDSRCDRRS